MEPIEGRYALSCLFIGHLREPGCQVGGIFEDRHRIIDAFRSEGWYVFEANQTRTQF